MENNLLFVKKICDEIIKYSVYIVAFLIPILFLPFTTDVFDFNKQALLLLFVLAALFAWMVRALMDGKFEIKNNYALIAVGLFFLSSVLSTIFSINRYGSFWGWPQLTSASLLTVSCLCALYFLISNSFSKKEILTLAQVAASGAILAGLMSAVMTIFPKIGFGYFNTIGSPGSMGLFMAILLPLMITLLIISKKWFKWLFAFGIIVSALVFIFVNYAVVWWVVLAGSAIVMIFCIFKKNFFDARFMALPMFFLAISVFFLILNPQIKWLPNSGNEIFLSQKTNFQIDSNVLSATPVLGSGLGTFSYDFLQYKTKDISASSFWNIVFDRGSSQILTLLATTGILGLVLFLVAVLVIIFYGGKFLFLGEPDDQDQYILVSGLLSSVVVAVLAYFMYSANLVLDFAFFALLAMVANYVFEKKKEYLLKQNSFLMLVMVFIFTIVFIFGIGLLALEGQRYYAEANYKNGLNEWQKGNINTAILDFETAASNNSSTDLYFTQLSQAYLLKLQNDLSGGKLTSDQKNQEIQALSANAINAAKVATDLNPRSANDWSVRAFIYQNLVGISADMETWAEKSYQQAISLDPFNPYLQSQLGILYYQKKDYANAQKQFQVAENLNPAYSLAIYYSGLNYDAQNNKANAITEFKKLLVLNPGNKDIQTIIENLNAGKSALAGASQPAVATPQSPSLKIPATTPAKTTK